MTKELLEKIKARSTPEPITGCWIWTGSLVFGKYPVFSHLDHNLSARQVAYQSANGPIPSATRISSICHNMSCVNPEHMRISSACCHGHDHATYGYINAFGMRRCRACERERYQRNKKRKGAKP